jgi:hypothetical protein
VKPVSVKESGALLNSQRLPPSTRTPSLSSPPRRNGDSTAKPMTEKPPLGCSQIWSSAEAR